MKESKLEIELKNEGKGEIQKSSSEYKVERTQEFSPEYKIVKEYCGLLNARSCKCRS